MQRADLDLHVLAQLFVEGRERLVHQDQLRLEDDRAGERDALLLAAGELVDAALAEACQLHQRQRGLDPSARSRRERTRRAFSGKATLSATLICGNSA